MAEYEQPIRVTDTVLPAMAATAIRYVIVGLAPMAIAKGWVDADNVEGIVTAVLAVVAAIYAVLQTRRRKKDLIKVAKAAPNNVAIVVGPTVGTLADPDEP